MTCNDQSFVELLNSHIEITEQEDLVDTHQLTGDSYKIYSSPGEQYYYEVAQQQQPPCGSFGWEHATPLDIVIMIKSLIRIFRC